MVRRAGEPVTGGVLGGGGGGANHRSSAAEKQVEELRDERQRGTEDGRCDFGDAGKKKEYPY